MRVKRSWVVGMAVLLILRSAYFVAGAAEGDYVVQGGGGGGGGSATSTDPNAYGGGGGGASYWGMAGADGDNYGAGTGGDGGGASAGLGGSPTANNGGAGGTADGESATSDVGGEPGAAWDEEKDGWNADATKGLGGTGADRNAGAGGKGAHATTDGKSAYTGITYNGNAVAFDLKEVPDGFDVSAGSKVTVEGGNGGGGGLGSGILYKGGAGGDGGDAALKITNTGTGTSGLGTLVVTGGDAGSSFAAGTGGTSGSGGDGGSGLVILSTDLTIGNLSITGGKGADHTGGGTAGSAAFLGESGKTLTVTGNGTVAVTAGTAGVKVGGSATFAVDAFKAGAGTTATLDVSQAASGTHTVSIGALDASEGSITALLDNRNVAGTDSIALGDLRLAGGKVISFDAGAVGGAEVGTHFKWTGASITVAGNGTLRYDGFLDLTEAIDTDKYKTLSFDLAGWDGTSPVLSIENASGVRAGGLKIDGNTNIAVASKDFGIVVEKRGFGGAIDLTSESIEGAYTGTVTEYTLSDGYGGTGKGAYQIAATDESAPGAGDAKLVVKDQNRLHSSNWSVGADTAWGSDAACGAADFQIGTLNLVDSDAGLGYALTFSKNAGLDSLLHVGTLTVRTNEAVGIDLSAMNAYTAGVSTADGAYFGGLSLLRGANLTLTGEQDVNFSWGKALSVVDNAALAIDRDLDISGGALSFLISGDYDSTAAVLALSGTGTLIVDASTGIDIKFSDGMGNLAAGSIITLVDGNFDGNALNGRLVDAWDGAYNTQYQLDASTGSLLAGVMRSGLDQELVHNMLMSASALTTLLVGGAGTAANAAGGFIPMGPVGEEFSGMQYGGYAHFGADSIRIDTGSHIKSGGFHLLAGAGVRFNHGASNTDVGLFFESGWGNYDTVNSYSSGGDSSYTGAGLLYRHDTHTGLYGEASFRAGSAKADYDGVSALVNRAGTKFDYSMRSSYYGGHVGFGYILKHEGGNATIELTAKALWTHLDGKGTRVRNTNDRIVLDDTNSSRSRLGAKYCYNLGTVTVHGGLAWEHEFNGKTSGVYQSASQGNSNIKSADIRGSSIVGEVGGEWHLTDRATLGGSAFGIVGKRQGVGGNVSVSLGF